MDIRSGLDGLKTLFGVAQPATPPAQEVKAQQGSNVVEINSVFGGDIATLSSAGSEIAQSASDGVVREEKVANIRAALLAGTYDVSSAAVASRMVDAMLGVGQ